MAGPVHLIDQPDTVNDTAPGGRLALWLENSVFVCLAAVALLASLSTKGAVNAFRAATLLWLVSLITRRRSLLSQPLALPIILFLVLTAVSSAFSVDPFLSWGRMRTVSLLFLAIVVGQALRSMRQLKILCALLIGSCLLTVLYTGWQYTAGIVVQVSGDAPVVASLRRFGIVRGDIIRKIGGARIWAPQDLTAHSLPPSQIELLLWRETPNALQPSRPKVNSEAFQAALKDPRLKLVRAHPPRAQAFFKHYFPFSEILVFIGLLMWALAVSGVPDHKLRIGLVIAFLSTATTLALTLTRISLVSLSLGALLILLMRGTRRTQWIGVAAVLVVACAAFFWVQSHRGSPESDPGTAYRLMMWRDSLHMIRAHPLLGVGLDAVAGDWQRWNLEAYRRFGLHSHFHSTPIQLAVECGLPALAVWLWLLVGYAVFLVRQHRLLVDGDWFSRGLLLGALGGLAGFVLTGFLQYNHGDAEAMVVFWLIVGMTFAASRFKGEARSQPVSTPAS